MKSQVLLQWDHRFRTVELEIETNESKHEFITGVRWRKKAELLVRLAAPNAESAEAKVCENYNVTESWQRRRIVAVRRGTNGPDDSAGATCISIPQKIC
jgi:hypothetical protein